MSEQVKVALIIAGAIIIAMLLWIYFSPMQMCMRDLMARGYDWSSARALSAMK